MQTLLGSEVQNPAPTTSTDTVSDTLSGTLSPSSVSAIEEDDGLGASGIIGILLIAVGVVLILLAIAIIIKLYK